MTKMSMVVEIRIIYPWSIAEDRRSGRSASEYVLPPKQ